MSQIICTAENGLRFTLRMLDGVAIAEDFGAGWEALEVYPQFDFQAYADGE